jgi:transcriptional regulator with XRE-family HTH domain
MTRGQPYSRVKVATDLAAARKLLGLSQAAVAKRAGLTQAAVSRMEAGSLNPQLSTFLDLARALELDVRLVPRQATPALDALLSAQEQSTKPRPRRRAIYALDTDEET